MATSPPADHQPRLLRHQSSTRTLLSPLDPADNADASSIRSVSDQDTDSDDDERLRRARNSRELRAHDRLVLMEEEELDALVTASRQKERRGSGLEGRRRGSGLVPVLAKTVGLLRRSGSRSREGSVEPGSREDLLSGDEKRRR
ncbi:hypothetical protein NKR19_g9900, partial [Coniochaeta hoffmannii]